MDSKAIEARRAYQKQWREKNRERRNAYHKAWRDRNPDKIKKYSEEYWQKKAEAAAAAE